MQSDLYTKVILTLMALFLGVLAFDKIYDVHREIVENEIQIAIENEKDPCDAGVPKWIDQNGNIHKCSETSKGSKDIAIDEDEAALIERLIREK